MLVVTRRIGERLLIGDQIQVSVLEVEGQRVRLGIEAPKDIKVLRQEVYELIQSQNQSASQAANWQGLSHWMRELKKED